MAYPNWFAHYAERYFAHHLPSLAGGDMHAIITKPFRFLQIGAFTGDASVWLLDHFPTATLTDVDTWEGSDEPEHDEYDWYDVEQTYHERMAPYFAEGRLLKFACTSRTFFLEEHPKPFDFIYIDGDHTAVSVLEDAVNAIPLLKVGGLIAFDDYLWQTEDRDSLKSPRLAVDAVEMIYAKQLKRLSPPPNVDPGDLQVWFRRASV